MNSFRKFLIFLMIILSFLFASCNINNKVAKFKKTVQNNDLIINKINLQKDVFYNDRLTTITSIVNGDFGKALLNSIGVIDQLGLSIVGFDGTLKKRIRFEWERGILNPEILFCNEGDFYIVAGGQRPIGLMDNQGKPVWVNRKHFMDKMVLGDIDNHYKTGLYLIKGFSLTKLDMNGNKIWIKPMDHLYDISTLRKNKDGKSIIVTSYQDNKICFWDYEGELINQWIAEKELFGIQIIKWLDSWKLVAHSVEEIYVYELDGEIVMKQKPIKMPSLIYSMNCDIMNTTNCKGCLAVLLKFSSLTNSSMLCIFDDKKQLVYQEMLRRTTGILSVNDPMTNDQILLVGDGPGKVNKYFVNE